jgi:2-desacetyl-2-hydroxyethyl bacteriochlorophyllide A dehydrogenase
MADLPATTVLIRTFNEARRLPALLQSLEQQAYRDFEIVVVDSGSVDGTREIAQRAGAKVIRIDRDHFTFGYSLNVGVGSGLGRFIAIVSAHTLPVDEHWLGSLVAPLSEPTVAMVYGRQCGAPESKFSEVQDLRRTFGAERLVLRPPNFFANNANAAIRRELWMEHPFDAALTGLEDIDWARCWMQKGYDVVYEPAAAIYHIHEESWQQVRRRYYREAVAARRIGLKRRREIPREVVQESAYLLVDLGLAVREAFDGRLKMPVGRCAREIVSFRANKMLGTARGLMDGAMLANRETRDEFYFDRSYQAVVIDGPGKAALRQIPMPEVRPSDVAIKVGYVGVCGTDLEILDGKLGYFAEGLAAYPIVPGHEMSGRVVAVGASVQGLREHDPVVVECIQSCGNCEECARENWIGCAERRELGVLKANGAYGQYVVVPSRFVHRLPDTLDLARAALCEPLAVVLKGLDRLSRSWGSDTRSRNCAVVGAGPLGRLCAIVLAHRGHVVTVFDRDPSRLVDFEKLGISTGSDLDNLQQFEAIAEITGNPDSLEAILENSRAGSAILLLGFPYARKPFNFERVVAYDKTIVGSVGSGSKDFRNAIELIPHLELDRHLQQVLPLARFEEAWTMARKHECFKILLKVE